MVWANGFTRTSTADHKARVKRVLKRDGHLCQLRLAGCTIGADAMDHIIGTAAGGAETDDNCQAACKNCNDLKAQQEAREGRVRKGRRRPPARHPGAI